MTQQNLKRMYDFGIRITTGMDVGNMGQLHGASLHREMKLMSEAGFIPDTLILGSNPLADIRNAADIETVISRGNIFTQSELLP